MREREKGKAKEGIIQAHMLSLEQLILWHFLCLCLVLSCERACVCLCDDDDESASPGYKIGNTRAAATENRTERDR